MNTSINLKNLHISRTHKNEANQRPRPDYTSILKQGRTSDKRAFSSHSQKLRENDKLQLEMQHNAAASNASQLFDNSLLCCLTQSKKTKPSSQGRHYLNSQTMAQPIRAMGKGQGHQLDSSYQHTQLRAPFQGKRALSEEQKARQLVASTRPGQTINSSNDSEK